MCVWRSQVFVWEWITCVKFSHGISKSVYLLCITLSKPISKFLELKRTMRWQNANVMVPLSICIKSMRYRGAKRWNIVKTKELATTFAAFFTLPSPLLLHSNHHHHLHHSPPWFSRSSTFGQMSAPQVDLNLHRFFSHQLTLCAAVLVTTLRFRVNLFIL